MYYLTSNFVTFPFNRVNKRRIIYAAVNVLTVGAIFSGISGGGLSSTVWSLVG